MTSKKLPGFRHSSSDGITIEVQQNKPLESPFDLYDQDFGLYTKALVELITTADYPFMWDKGDFELQAKFYAHILSAVALHYEIESTVEQEMTEYETLIQLLNVLKNDYHLLQGPIAWDEDDDDDDFLEGRGAA